MHKLAIVLGAAIGIAAIGAFTASGKPASGYTTLTFVQKQTSLVVSGKTVAQTHDLIARGKTVGHDQIQCVVTGPGASFECLSTAVLPNGQIDQLGAINPTIEKDQKVAITGGTGSYTSATGWVNVEFSHNPVVDVYHFKIIH